MQTPQIVTALDGTKLAPFFTKRFVFSNHYSCSFIIDNINYSSTEQYYMQWKAIMSGNEDIAQQISNCHVAGDIKRMGSHLRGHDTAKWRKICILIMTIANWAKYSQNV